MDEINKKAVDTENLEKKIKESRDHKFLIKIDSYRWKKFLEFVPQTMSANEKLNELIANFIINQELARGVPDAEKSR